MKYQNIWNCIIKYPIIIIWTFATKAKNTGVKHGKKFLPYPHRFDQLSFFVEHCLRECNRKLNNEGYIVFRRYGNKDIVLKFYTQLQPQETRLILHKCKKQADEIKDALLDYPHEADWLCSPREIPGANPHRVGRNTF